MRLLNKPLDKEEKDFLLDMLKGDIARICASDEVEEIVVQLGFAIDRISTLAYSRIKQLKEVEKDEEDNLSLAQEKQEKVNLKSF